MPQRVGRHEDFRQFNPQMLNCTTGVSDDERAFVAPYLTLMTEDVSSACIVCAKSVVSFGKAHPDSVAAGQRSAMSQGTALPLRDGFLDGEARMRCSTGR